MHSYVINLPQSTERRARVARQLLATGIEHSFIRAVDGRALSPSERAELVDEDAVRRSPAWLTPGAIGCILSHRVAYQRFLQDGGRVALVLEDDAQVPKDAGALLTRLAELVRPDEVMLLNFRSFTPARLSRSDAVAVDGYSVLRPVEPQQMVSSLAYLIGDEAAASLANAIVPVRVAADSWGDHVEHGRISLRCVFPVPIDHDTTLESTLGYSDESVTSRVEALRHFWPVRQLRSANRLRIKRRMSRVVYVD